MSGNKIPTPGPDAVMISIQQVRARYGGVDTQWVDRRILQKVDPFPKPIRFGSKRFFLLREIEEWEQRRIMARSETLDRRVAGIEERRATRASRKGG